MARLSFCQRLTWGEGVAGGVVVAVARAKGSSMGSDGGTGGGGSALERERDRERAFARLLLDPFDYIFPSIYSSHGT
jgi:hypothetical protein